MAGKRVSELVDRPIKIILSQGQTKKFLKNNEEHFKGLWDIKQSEMSVTGVKEGKEEKEKE